jgi:ABC-type dipeptide/oligopeptide/nickel transport system permease subunit
VSEGSQQMSSGKVQAGAVGEGAVVKQRSSLELTALALMQDKVAVGSLVLIVVAVILAVGAPVISPYQPNQQTGGRLESIGSPGHILGTDFLGRDVLSRILWGGRVSLPTAIAPVIVAGVIATVIGISGGYFRLLGEIIMRVNDIFFAVPFVLLAVGVAAILGPGMMNVMLSMSVFLIPWMSRIIYTEVVGIRGSEFVEAAEMCGSSRWEIMVREILPNAIAPIIVACTIQAGAMIVVAAGLSFLGLGVQPPTADWGIMVAEGQKVLSVSPHLATVPGLVILVVSLAFNLMGDGLRDALDPRLRTAKSQV